MSEPGQEALKKYRDPFWQQNTDPQRRILDFFQGRPVISGLTQRLQRHYRKEGHPHDPVV